jgi:hypothetical protein
MYWPGVEETVGGELVSIHAIFLAGSLCANDYNPDSVSFTPYF